MQITNIKNAAFANALQTAINCEIQISSGEWLPFTASETDSEQHGRDVFAAIIESGNVVDYVDTEFQSEPVPQAVTARQGREALIRSGIMPSTVKDAIENITDTVEREIALNYWEYSLNYERYHPVVLALAPLLNLSDDGLDSLFILGSTL